MANRAASPVAILVRLHGLYYYYSESAEAFVMVPRVPSDLPLQLNRAVTSLKGIQTGGL